MVKKDQIRGSNRQHHRQPPSTTVVTARGIVFHLQTVMVFASAGASSALNGISKARQASLLTAFDNKYAKRQSQIENNRLQLEIHRYKIQMEKHTKCIAFFFVVVAACLFSVWSLHPGWMTSSDYLGAGQEDKRSLQDLAESIRRVRLRRQEAIQDDTPKDGINEKGILHEGDKGWGFGRHIYPSQSAQGEDTARGASTNDLHLADPPDKFLIDALDEEKNSFDEESRLQLLEERIRINQEMKVKEEVDAKYAKDRIAESIDALKQYAENIHPLRSPDIEEESFS